METVANSSTIVLAARVFGVLVSLPIGDGLQTLPRLLISLCFGAALSGGIEPSRRVELYQLPLEFLIGVLLALPVRVFADSLEMLGEILDTARGQMVSSINDPLNGARVSDLASLFRIAAMIIAIHLGAMEQVLISVRNSYGHTPFVSGAFEHKYLVTIADTCVAITSASLSLSSVWLLVYLIVDLSTALLARTMHGLQFTSLGTMVKLTLTFVLLGNAVANPHEALPTLSRLTLPGPACTGD